MNSKITILEYIEKYLNVPALKPLVIATPNPEQVVLAQTDFHFRKVLNRADIAIPDGIGLALTVGCEKIAGIDLLESLVELASRRGFSIALIGGGGGVALKALECLQRRFPGLAGWADVPEGKTIEEITQKLAVTKTRLVFVGLGAPKQEHFCICLARQFQISNLKSQIVLMSVGGAFDMIAGIIPRAPSFVRAIGLEWLWRLSRQPRRWKRQLALLKFLWLMMHEH